MTITLQSALSLIPREMKLLVACLKNAGNSEGGASILGLIQAGIDWEDFVRLVNRHRVAAPVYQRHQHMGEGTVPEAAMNSLG